MKQRPIAVGLLVCEKIVIEAETRNLTLVNCFHQRTVASIPSEPVSFVVCALLTDGQGEMPFAVRIERLDTLQMVMERRGLIRCSSPLAETRFRVRMQEVRFPVSGLYQGVLLIDNEVVASRRIQVLHSTREEVP